MSQKLLGVLGVSAMLLAAPLAASAADLGMRYKAPPPPAPVYSWTGFYVGGAFGYGMWDADTQALADPTSPFTPGAALTSTVNNAGKGWVGQVNGGYDYQFNQYIVGGIFADFDPSSIKGTLSTATATNFFNALGGTEKETSSWAVGARVGLITLPGLFSYINGGYTQARFDAVNVGNLAGAPGLAPGPSPFTTAAHNYHGWFLGGGLESRLTFLPINGLFLRTEYRYSYYGAATLPIINTTTGAVATIGGVPTDLKIHPTVQTIMSGLDIKFNWTGH